jgi:hypothetical protein
MYSSCLRPLFYSSVVPVALLVAVALSIMGFPNVSPVSLLTTTNGFLGPVLSSQNVTYFM